MSEIVASTYEIIEQLGSGGGGVVYLANHIRLGKKVVLKADKRKITTRPELLRREVDILKELSHPNIPKVYDFFVEGETVYTVMDYIEGESLNRPLKRGERFSQLQVIRWAEELLDALCYLHSPVHGTPARGYVHSDIKPANLMRTADNHIFLIDFNIALALGETNVVGCSPGYASPEHYGLDFSTDSTTLTAEEEQETEWMDRAGSADTVAMTGSGKSSSLAKRTVAPDVRSDIYSTGATLYHLLSGVRPSKNAKEVISLSEETVSPLVAEIITKSMNPNPDLRYQTAEEMLFDFTHLRERDPRTRKFRRSRMTAGIFFLLLFVSGAGTAFTGLKRMKTREEWLKIAAYAANALESGDTKQAVEQILSTLPLKRGMFTPEYHAESQRILSKALGVYDLSDGYKKHKVTKLPAEPFELVLSPDGKTAVGISEKKISLFDTETSEIFAELPAADSALAEAEYLDEHRIIYAGKDGLSVYDLEQRNICWTQNPATAISVSEDEKTAAAIWKDETSAVLYEIESGNLMGRADFGNRHQSVAVHDSFANPHDNLFALNRDGTRLAVSFEDGSLTVFDLKHPEETWELFEETSGYTHFEGGFYGDYLAFSASGDSGSVFAVVDTEKKVQTGGFESQYPFHVKTDSDGIYVQTENILVQIHPVTGEQIPLAETNDKILEFAKGKTQTMITTENEVLIFDSSANLIFSEKKQTGSDFVRIQAGTALLGSSDSPLIRIMRYENHPEEEIFSYDPSFAHDEARVSADGKTIMLFDYKIFRIYRIDGILLKETTILNPEDVYDEQYIREGNSSRLEVIYNDGTVTAYDALDGSLLYKREKNGQEKEIEPGKIGVVRNMTDGKPDRSLYEELLTEHFRAESPLHGMPQVYDRKTGKKLFEIKEDAYLTYLTECENTLIAQYVTADGTYYGQILNQKGEVLADLPWLCDVKEDRLYFDYPTGNIRESRIYNIKELIEKAQNEKGGKA